MFYDLETTSGNDLDNLKTISYFIMVYFLTLNFCLIPFLFTEIANKHYQS